MDFSGISILHYFEIVYDFTFLKKHGYAKTAMLCQILEQICFNAMPK